MLMKSELDRIIVRKNEDMLKIINWWYANRSWLDKEEFMAPMDSGLIVMEEEHIDIGFESRPDGLVTLSVYPEHIDIPAMQFELDPVTTKMTGHRFSNKIGHHKEMLLKVILEKDHTDVKESVKYMALMQFAARYKDIVEVDESQSVRRTRHEAKKMRRDKRQPLKLVKTTYVVKEFDGKEVSQFGEKRPYTKPDHEVSVRGYWRVTKKTGKKTWVAPFTRYKGKGNRKPKEYIV